MKTTASLYAYFLDTVDFYFTGNYSAMCTNRWAGNPHAIVSAYSRQPQE